MKISINQQIDEIDRELGQRASVYPRLVAAGKLRQSVADYQVERLKAAKRTLEFVRDHAEEIKRAVGAPE